MPSIINASSQLKDSGNSLNANKDLFNFETWSIQWQLVISLVAVNK